MSCAICHQLMTRFKCFKGIATDYQSRIQMLTAAICVGTTVAWGTPIGGVLLAVELTSTHFMVGTLLKGFFGSTVGIITLDVMYNYLPYIKPTKKTEFENIGLNHELIFIVILGVICA